MKITEKKKPVDTMPKGVWESSNPAQEKPASRKIRIFPQKLQIYRETDIRLTDRANSSAVHNAFLRRPVRSEPGLEKTPGTFCQLFIMLMEQRSGAAAASTSMRLCE